MLQHSKSWSRVYKNRQNIIKGKVVLMHTVTAYMGSKRMNPFIPNLGTLWR
jgi:hypothetical protein